MLKSDLAVAQRTPVVILFAETRGFLRKSDQLEAPVVLARLSEFLGLVSTAVERHNGTVLDGLNDVGSSRVDLQACKLEYSIVSPK